MNTSTKSPEVLDAVVVGAGLAGLYMLYRLRQQGLHAQVVEAAENVGGTWYWNAYPGARCDVESMDYCYSFSNELEQQWTWTERFASQPEILRYIEHVADRFDLRKNIEFNTPVVTAHWDESAELWTLTSASGRRFVSRFAIFATGSLSAPIAPAIPDADRFAGTLLMTQAWPRGGVDLRGRRVAVIGTGSSGIQLIPSIAQAAKEVVVFQRTPNFAVPGRNRPLRVDEITARRAHAREYRERQRRSRVGTVVKEPIGEALAVPEDQRLAEMQERWDTGGSPLFTACFADTMTDLRANHVVQDFVRSKIHHAVTDPDVAERLCPYDHPIGAKRLCVENGYFAAFNRSNVRLVDLRSDPIERMTRNGIALVSGTEHSFDVIVYATGYDALTGALSRIDIRGRGGQRLSSSWQSGPTTYLGLAVAGFPNLFTIAAAGSPSVFTVMTVLIEQQVEWISDCIAFMQNHRYATIEASATAQTSWTAHLEDLAKATLYPHVTRSYYVGGNVPGKPHRFALYIGGMDAYRGICDSIARNGYEGFLLGNSPPATHLTPGRASRRPSRSPR